MAEDTEVIYVRRAEIADAKGIEAITTDETRSLFGRFNIIGTIEKAVFSVTVSNDLGEIVGHASFYDYPNVKSVDPTAWESWAREKPSISHCKPINTLFCHVLVARAGYTEGITREILHAVFNAVPTAHYVVFTPPKDILPNASLALNELFPLVTETPESVSYEIRLANRHSYCPVLHIRPARVEDHDDLTPIFNKQNDVLSSTYGDYFLAELIEAQDDYHKAIVAEVEGTAIAFMSLSAEVNVDLLASCFELGPFHGLRKVNEADTWEERTATESSKSSLTSLLSETEQESRPASVATGAKQDCVSRPASALSSGQSRSLIESQLSLADTTRTRLSVISQNSLATASGVSVATTGANVKSSVRERSVEPQKPKKTIQIPIYKGTENAFCVQLFCIDERYEMRSVDLLPAAFDLFPDKDFCIITQPHTTPEYPLLQNFTRVTPKPTSTLHQELYIAHRCSLLDDVIVRQCTPSDREGIESTIKGIDNSEGILNDVDQYNKAGRDPQDEGSTPLSVFVAECQTQIIGVFVVRQERNIEYIRSHYNVEGFVYYAHHRREEHARLHHFVLNPVFGHYTKHVLKELLRLSRKSCMYYPIYPSSSESAEIKTYSLATCINDLIPVRGRRQIVYPLDRLGENAPSERILKKMDPFALYHLNRKLTLEPKITINARIVVVGASDVGLSFLESLCFSPHLRFNNLILVSPNGLPKEQTMLPTSHCFSSSELAQASLATWVNVVRGKIVAIDRERKMAIVSSGAELPYDLLILCTGVQYQTSVTPKPKSIFALNDEKDCRDATTFIKKACLDTEDHAIVYGNSLSAYSTVEGLLSLGLKGEQIEFVKPPLEASACFGNATVAELVEKELRERGVSVRENFLFTSWNETDDVAHFTQGTDGKLELHCKAFFAFDRRGIDYDVFRAINDCCLVFDGRLVVDADFRTNDASIRGAGSLTKFARRYHADEWSFGHFNSREVGKRLASSVLRDYDPVSEPSVQNDAASQRPPLIPSFSQPKITGARLPGDYFYLHIRPPAVSETKPPGENVLVTENSDSGYFQIKIDKFNRVHEITCLTKQDLDASNLICLYNLNEKYLNRMVDRYEEGLIKDFYSFFREPWVLAVFHDRFRDFQSELREIAATRTDPDTPSLEEHVRNLLKVDKELAPLDEDALTRNYGSSSVKAMIDKRIFSFLSYNRYHLSMYARQQMI
ncbi:cilia- and flagella-associated protein 61-like isoform X2 [Oscarella lobularis]|uniref:cilia- and flagella-associated protein 61-like isoform X2 n=1 Tax=Oscarella lobularis TaxID=121494 RepID=UPI0033141DFB